MESGSPGESRETHEGTEKGERYEYRLIRGSAPHGGIVVRIFYSRGSRPFVEAMYLTELHTSVFLQVRAGVTGALAHGEAIERLLRVTYDLAKKAS